MAVLVTAISWILATSARMTGRIWCATRIATPVIDNWPSSSPPTVMAVLVTAIYVLISVSLLKAASVDPRDEREDDDDEVSGGGVAGETTTKRGEQA